MYVSWELVYVANYTVIFIFLFVVLIVHTVSFHFVFIFKFGELEQDRTDIQYFPMFNHTYNGSCHIMVRIFLNFLIHISYTVYIVIFEWLNFQK